MPGLSLALPSHTRMHTGDKKQVVPALAGARAQLVLWDKAGKDEEAPVASGGGVSVLAEMIGSEPASI